MRKIVSAAALVLAAVIVGCASGSSSPWVGFGERPALPGPQRALIPTVKIAPARGWPAGAAPVAPSGFTVPIREIRLSAGAGFITPLCGEMRTMPGLPSKPGGENIDIDADGNVVGLF